MLEFLPLHDLRRQLEVNLVGLLAVTQAFLPQLRMRRPARGRIVNVGSTSGYLAAPLLGAYSASKFALEGLSDTLRLELAPFGIEVSLVEPGPIRTPIFEKTNADAEARLETLPPEAQSQYTSMVGAMRAIGQERARRAISPESVAQAVAHALGAARPRTRYRVGLDAKLEFALARLLPDRARDFVLSRYLGITKA
jgi:NAD(P)-dependent dehydrogenase (short-subunit alcohol dehydrogenase family)